MSTAIATAAAGNRSAARTYLFLSGLTGVLELGVVLFAARSGWPVWVVVGLGVLYQVASLFVRPFGLGPRGYRVMLGAGAVAGAVTPVASLAVAPAVAFTAIGLQGIREEQLSAVSVATLSKRSTRIVGFVGASAFNSWFLLAIPIIVGVIAWLRPVPTARPPRPRLGRPVPHELLMVVHQTHYFAYSYVLLFVLVGLHPGRALIAAAAFALGWVSYSVAPTLLARFPTLPTLVAGHTLVAATLIVIALNIDDASVVTAAWVVGGFGGGTVFCIKRLGSRSQLPPRNMESWENVGHVSGSVLALIAVVLLSVPGAFVVAAGASTLTAICAVVINRRGAPSLS